MGMSKEQIEYAQTIAKAASGVCPECDKPYSEHVYPEKVPCPDCGRIDKVHMWEAWGHPDGTLECLACFPHGTLRENYHTFYKGEDGQTVIVPWRRTVIEGEGEWDEDEESGPD